MNRGKQLQMAKDDGTSRTEMSWTLLKLAEIGIEGRV